MLGLHQRDGLGQGRPLTSDQPSVQFAQQPLLGPGQVRRVRPEGRGHVALALPAVTRDGAPVTGEDPQAETARPGARVDSGRGGRKGDVVAEEGEADPSHVRADVGHLVRGREQV